MSFAARSTMGYGFEFTARPQRPVYHSRGIPARAFKNTHPYVNDIVTTRRQAQQPYARFYRPATLVSAQHKAAAKPHTTATTAAHVVHKKRGAKTTKRNWLANASVALAICMSILLAYVAYRYHVATSLIESKHASALSVSDKASAPGGQQPPSETKPAVAGGTAYRADPTAPAHLSIEKIGVDASIIPRGIAKNGEMAVPGTIWQVGWFTGSARPTDNGGAIVLNGHVHGPTQPGVFYNLKKLAAGDIIKLTTGNGTEYQYRVVKTATYTAGDMGADLYQAVSMKQGLNMVTCTGKFDSGQGEYAQRLVVYSERI